MNNTITDREELLLAKIAGKDVDIKTMTPGVASNLKEKLMLDIADRIDQIESKGDGADLPDNKFTATYTNADGTWTCDKTFSEILAAIEADKQVSATGSFDVGNGVTMEGSLKYTTTMKINGVAAAVAFETTSISAIDNSLAVISISHSAQEAISCSMPTFTAQT